MGRERICAFSAATSACNVRRRSDSLTSTASTRVLWAGEEHQQFALELAGQRFGQLALKVMGADARQRLCIAGVGPMRIGAVRWHSTKSGIVPGQILGQPGIGRFKRC